MSSNSKKLTLAEIKARLQVVCICKGIRMSRICEAIQGGCNTVEAVNKATGSGDGGCGATRCRPVITQLLAAGGRPLPVAEVPTEDDEDFLT